MSGASDLWPRLKGRLIVSCQASEGQPFRSPEAMAEFAKAAVLGGAAGIRANGPEDIRAIRRAVDAPIVGIQKRLHADGKILITGSLADAGPLVEAGADLIALDCTRRGQGCGALERLREIRATLGVPVLADIATVEEAVAAADAGAGAVLSTMRGYTAETGGVRAFEPQFIARLTEAVRVPVIAEGRIHTPEEAVAALQAGAFAAIVGTAITRPAEIACRFASAIERFHIARAETSETIGIDLGGTMTKFGRVACGGRLISPASVPTPAAGGRRALLDHLKKITVECRDASIAAGRQPRALGIATAGWVDPATGKVVFATENLPGWTGTAVGEELEAATGLPTGVENDANALAIAEKHFGTARQAGNFVCITLGTGVGGGCYVGGRLHRGAHFFANAIGHISIEPGGLPCTCGLRGCLEAYANSAALVRYAGGGFESAEAVIRAANHGDAAARAAIRTLAGYLARGCASIVALLDPELLILSGGLAEANPHLFEDLEAALAGQLIVADRRGLRIAASTLGYFGGVLGAGAVGVEALAAR
jgi:predicted NBD/HSP70 family sugar kinase/putative N-acetylmannosamine-6-phosphate epimerase